MNFKKLAEQKIDELSGKIPGKIDDVDSIDLVIEGLDEEIDQEESVVAEDISIELVDDELDIEKSEEKNEIQPVELFDGYLGQQKDVPNPLEYGPNATYRNLREGIVYKKGPDNLWEVFVKDGQNGKQGQSIGSGVGVEEVKRIVSESVVPSQISTYSLQYDMPVLRKKMAGVLTSAGQDFIIGVVGDSHNQASFGGSGIGSGLINAYRNAPIHTAGRLLSAAGYPVNYDGYFGQRGEVVGLSAFDPTVSLSGTWTYNNGGNKALGNGILRATTGSVLVKRTEAPWDVCDVWIAQGITCSGTIVMSAIGSSATTYDFSGKTPVDMVKFTITKPSVNFDPLVINVTLGIGVASGFDAPGIAAFDFKNSKQSQIRIHNHAIGGASMGSHVASAAQTSNFYAYQDIGMDVIFVESFLNEIRGGATKAVWLSNWNTFLNTFDTSARDIFVYMGFPANPATNAWISNGTFEDWMTSLKEILDSRKINMFDARKIFGTTYERALSEGILADDYHPNRTGLSMKAQFLFKHIMENNVRSFE